MSTQRATICFLVVLFGPASRASDEAPEVSYQKHIKPLLAEKCYACHSALKQEGSLRLETRELMLRGGDSGAVVAVGDPDGSLLLERVTDDDDSRMPPAEDGARLKPDEVALLRRWIASGAPAPHEEIPAAPVRHWAFQPIRRPDLPATDRNPIDALLSAKRAQKRLVTQPPAERSLLLRRLYLDLIGLPPSMEQLHDARPLPQVIDELLASPHHGERWGRHWMDIWRYSDWYGLGAQLRNSQKHIWRWRDWIVKSLNDDKGYDRMIQEMLAGDELDPHNPDAITGTGFLARNYYLFNRTTWLDSTIEHTGKAFFGLTLNCAKCHDHKYDPISHVDYYSFRAIFEPHQVRLDPVPGETDLEKDGLPRVFDDHTDAETWLHKKGDPKNPDRDTPIRPRVPALFASFQPEIRPVALPPEAWAPGARDYVHRDLLLAVQRQIDAAKKQLNAAREKLAVLSKQPKETTPQPAEDAFSFVDTFDKPNPDAWEVVGDWKYEDGKLVRTTSTRDTEFVRFRKPLPRDFELTCRYTTTGGTTYKSVTFRFDESQDRKYANYVYTSAHAPGPKVQIAFTRNGNHSYPPDGRRAHPINVGEMYELRFAVRDRLVNVWLNDKFLMAWQFPDRGTERRLSLSGFDATVAYDRISIRALPADVKLASATNSPVVSPADAEGAVRVAEARLLAAERKLASVQATVAAERQKYADAGTSAENRLPLFVEAARAQAVALQAEAEYEKLASGGDAAKTKAANAKLRTAQQKLAAADKGEYEALRASRKALEGPAHKEADYPPTYSPISTGRRLALARWATARENPLTARVAVNHVWMRHFGTPLVESVFDFGLRARQPVHADLLDFLAAEFMDSGWSFRHLHRLILTSETWQLASTTADADEHTRQADPDNVFYWRMNPRRMEAQIVRDSILQLAGVLDLTVGGPSLDVGNNSLRRSIYFKHSRDQRDKFLSMFDDADLLQCYRRSESIVPQQALALANSQLSMTNAAKVAERISRLDAVVDSRSFIATAFEMLLGRRATEEELSTCLAYCSDLAALPNYQSEASLKQRSVRVRSRFILSLLNHNDFVTIR